MNITKNAIILHETDSYDWFYWFYVKDNNQYKVYSLMNEDDELGYLIYLEVIVSTEQFNLFKSKELSYRELIQQAIELYEVTTHYNYELSDRIKTDINHIDLPHKSSYYQYEYTQTNT